MSTRPTSSSKIAAQKELNIDRPELNDLVQPNITPGIVVETSVEGQTQLKMMTRLTILQPVIDVEDFRNNLYSAYITNDSKGIMISMPLQPRYAYTNPKRLLQDKKASENASKYVPKCEQTLNTHRAYCTRMKSEENKTKSIYFTFPDAMSCTNAYFNKNSEEKKGVFALVANYDTSWASYSKSNSHCMCPNAHVYYEMAVEHTIQDVAVPKQVRASVNDIIDSTMNMHLDYIDDDDDDDGDNSGGTYY